MRVAKNSARASQTPDAYREARSIRDVVQFPCARGRAQPRARRGRPRFEHAGELQSELPVATPRRLEENAPEQPGRNRT
jgi:hypothetical protein